MMIITHLAALRPLSRGLSRQSTRHTSSTTRQTSRRIRTVLAIGTIGTAVYLAFPTPVHAESPTPKSNPSTPPPSIQSLSNTALLRSYLVYTLCSLPPLIDYSPQILKHLSTSSIPFVASLTETIVRSTFFAQFVPGETVLECMTTMRDLRARGVGSVLNYSAEVDLDGVEGGGEKFMRELEAKRLREVERALDEAGIFELECEKKGGLRGSTAFALKVTGLIDPEILHRASTTLLRLRTTISSTPMGVPYPGTPLSSDRQVLAPETKKPNSLASVFALKGPVDNMGVLSSDEGIREGDLEALQDLWTKLKGLGDRAKKNGVKLMIDAEHTWYQPALDAYTLLLSEEFNKPPKITKLTRGVIEPWGGPLIYGTYQSYLVRQPQYLIAALRHAEANGYALGVKLVRGAYFMQERKKWKDESRLGADPIWPDKAATDKAYNTSIKTIISTLSSQLDGKYPELAMTVVFGTHNSESVGLVVETLEKQGLASRSSPLADEVVEGEGRLKLRDDVRGRVFIAQLYGMKDDLMDRVTQSFEPSPMPIALKYIAYGKLSEVMPFLGRRAIENKSLMSGDEGAAAERRRIWQEMKRRWLGIRVV